jgi:dTDP-4-dehydrorhamnose reductase
MRILIIGSGGRLGAALMREYGASASQPMKGSGLGPGNPSHNFQVTGFNHEQLDLADLTKTAEIVSRSEFDVLINAAAFTNVDLAEKEKDQAFRVNRDGPRRLAEICRDKGARLIHISTDYVFDGEKTDPYTEEDEPRPLSVYGASKRAGEEAVLSTGGNHLVVRVSWVFGPDRPSFVDQMIARAREHEQIAAVADKWSTPTYTRDIAAMLQPIIAATTASPARTGILHIANFGQCTWQEYAQHAIDCCHEAGVQLKAKQVGAVKMSDMKNWVARRPVHTVLGTAKYEKLAGGLPRHWRDAVANYVREFVAIREE